MKVKITIGDWSQDGHNQYEEFIFESNKELKEIQDAYKKSCVKTGLQFNYNTNYSGLKEHDTHRTERHICCNYEESSISDLAIKILKEHDIKLEDSNLYVESFLELLINFIKISLPDLTLEEASFKKSELKDIPAVNGWWNEELNEQFGYGLFE